MFENINIIKLRKLLLSEKEFEGKIDIDSKFENYISTKSVNGNSIYEIYSIRKNISSNMFKGFDKLMSSLENEKKTKIKVHNFKIYNIEYVVFTDSKVERLLGYLKKISKFED